jgi:hypothetical protein
MSNNFINNNNNMNINNNNINNFNNMNNYNNMNYLKQMIMNGMNGLNNMNAFNMVLNNKNNMNIANNNYNIQNNPNTQEMNDNNDLNNNSITLYFEYGQKEIYLDTHRNKTFKIILDELKRKYVWLSNIKINAIRYEQIKIDINNTCNDLNIPNESKIWIIE